jgi:hypothetical protein
MLHCQMMRDVDASEKKKKMLPFFCEESYTQKVVKEVRLLIACLHFEAYCAANGAVCSAQIPAVKQIYAFLKQVFEVGQFNPECCVISLVYINRLIGVTGVPLTQSNWKPGNTPLLGGHSPKLPHQLGFLISCLTVALAQSLSARWCWRRKCGTTLR